MNYKKGDRVQVCVTMPHHYDDGLRRGDMGTVNSTFGDQYIDVQFDVLGSSFLMSPHELVKIQSKPVNALKRLWLPFLAGFVVGYVLSLVMIYTVFSCNCI